MNLTVPSPNFSHSLEILLKIIFRQYFTGAYCFTLISDSNSPFEYLPRELSYFRLKPDDNLKQNIFDATEIGCSNYLVQMAYPADFVKVLDKVNRLSMRRNSKKRLVFVPPVSLKFFDSDSIFQVLNMTEVGYISRLLLLIPYKINDCWTWEVFTHKFVGYKENFNAPLLLDEWNSCTEQFRLNADLLPHDMSNMYGKELKVACYHYNPYTLLDLDRSVAPKGIDGLDVRIVDGFCDLINCTLVIKRETKQSLGTIFKNKTGVGVLGSVYMDKADFGITSVSPWYDMYMYIDYSTFGMKTTSTCLVPAPKILQRWDLALLPLKWQVWITTIAISFAMCTALVFLQGDSKMIVFMRVFGVVLGQSQPNYTNLGTRRLSIWLLLTSVALYSCYCSGLSCIFTAFRFEKGLNSIRDLVESGMEWGAPNDGWVTSMDDDDPLITKLKDNFHVYSEEELIEKSLEQKIAIALEITESGYISTGSYITADTARNYRLMSEALFYEYNIIAARKGSPYFEKLNTYITRLRENGILLAWDTQVALKYSDWKTQQLVKYSRNMVTPKNEPFYLQQVAGFFIAYVFGVILSIVVFIIEINYGI